MTLRGCAVIGKQSTHPLCWDADKKFLDNCTSWSVLFLLRHSHISTTLRFLTYYTSCEMIFYPFKVTSKCCGNWLVGGLSRDIFQKETSPNLFRGEYAFPSGSYNTNATSVRLQYAVWVV